jgi:hypothetical protein
MVQRSLIFLAALNLILLYSATIASGKSFSRGKYLFDRRSYNWALEPVCCKKRQKKGPNQKIGLGEKGTSRGSE